MNNQFEKIFENTIFNSTQIQFDLAATQPKGTILLIHGTAPQNFDGTVPIKSLQDKIQKADPNHYIIAPTYKELSEALNKLGWNTVRYTRTGVYQTHVNESEYSKTDLNNIVTQLKTIWKNIPRNLPRFAFAWSGGSIHILQLDLEDTDGIIILGGIATKRTELHQYSDLSNEVKNEIQGQLNNIISMEKEVSRVEMLNLDMPYGRFYDEENLDLNWTYLKEHPKLNTLILHGTADKDVNSQQAELWKKNLPNNAITTIFKENANHAWGINGNQQDMKDLANTMNKWLVSL